MALQYEWLTGMRCFTTNYVMSKYKIYNLENSLNYFLKININITSSGNSNILWVFQDVVANVLKYDKLQLPYYVDTRTNTLWNVIKLFYILSSGLSNTVFLLSERCH